MVGLLISIFYPRSHTATLSQFLRIRYFISKFELSKDDIMADESILIPPKAVCGMKTLDRKLFSKSIVVPWLLFPESKVSLYSKYMKKYMLKLEHLKPLQDLDIQNDGKLINSEIDKDNNSLPGGVKQSLKRMLINPDIVKNYEDIGESDRANLENFGITKENFGSGEIVLTYENWRADVVLKAVLPPDVGSLTSYSKIGHIVHVNLKENLLDYKSVIGQVLLDKVPGARTVVNKTDTIDNTYRNFQMEILCGENDLKAQVRENRCVFEFDFSTVYWNPRLCTEHERILSLISRGDVLYDVFSGVGPFSIPAARHRHCELVMANDLNPESYHWLVRNSLLNKVPAEIFQAFNKDGWAFIVENVAQSIEKRWKSAFKSSEGTRGKQHVVMNLPARAPEFLGAFRGIFAGKEFLKEVASNDPLTVHVYCFATGENSHSEAVALVETNLGHTLTSKEVTFVRKVSPSKDMLRVTFELPMEALFISLKEQLPVPHPKRICLEKSGEKPGYITISLQKRLPLLNLG